MVVGTGKIKIRLFGAASLKEKRRIIKPMMQRVRNKFPVSIAETDLNDSLIWAEIGFSVTGNDGRYVNSVVDKVFDMVDAAGTVQIEDTQMEIFHL